MRNGGRKFCRFRHSALRTAHSAFTLLEVMLAVAIVGTALFGIAMAIGRCMAAAKAIDYHTTAHVLLEEKMQEFSVETNFVAGVTSGDFGEVAPGFEWKRDVELDDSQVENLYRQIIAVSWQDRGRLQDVTVSGMLFAPNAEEAEEEDKSFKGSNPANRMQ